MSDLIKCTFADDLRRARLHYGDEAQQLKCAEECAELAAATLRFNRKQMIEETADVLITAMNNREVLGRDAVDAEITRKLKRMNDRIDESEMRKTTPNGIDQ